MGRTIIVVGGCDAEHGESANLFGVCAEGSLRFKNSSLGRVKVTEARSMNSARSFQSAVVKFLISWFGRRPPSEKIQRHFRTQK